MERSDVMRMKTLLWFVLLSYFGMEIAAVNKTVSHETGEAGAYAWSSWGSWSPCSRTCGGGVSTQERLCLPRRIAVNATLPPPVITVRVTRRVDGRAGRRRARSAMDRPARHAGDCQGIARRYHECNTEPCSGTTEDTRADQCAAYDRRPYKGRFYTWVPYVDGGQQCLKNCRPLGQQFYASLGLVADGTPCTVPGHRAVCIQGQCKVVGREAVLAASPVREPRCGRRLVSGLFARPRLPLGYSYVATVPRGACRLNVTELAPTDNYIVLKITNGSFIINGDFAVSSPGEYDAVGTRFTYTRKAEVDSVFAIGPLRQAVDIMILYTERNPSIKYEYFTDLLPDMNIDPLSRKNHDSTSSFRNKHARRHHSSDTVVMFNGEEVFAENVIGGRKFIWEVLAYTECTRTCGGGIQIGKYRCIEVHNGKDREVSPVHCVGSPPQSKRRRCANTPCQPRWRAAAWSACPVCGPANATRVVGCVQDNSRGLIKISDQKCLQPKPTDTKACAIPDCIVSSRNYHNRSTATETDTFREGILHSFKLSEAGLDAVPDLNLSSTAEWIYTDWSECIGWCVGEGIQTRGARCPDPSGCYPTVAPDTSRPCTTKLECDAHDGEWFTGEWSRCTQPCKGMQVRGVLCIGGTGRHLTDSRCKVPKPAVERPCTEECVPQWFMGDWQKCQGECPSPIGHQQRAVTCGTDEVANSEEECTQKPVWRRSCHLDCNGITFSPVANTNLFEPFLTIRPTPTHQDCEDKLSNCALAVQSRLCNYSYYYENCCRSCKG